MEKLQLEQMLRDPAALERLLEWSRTASPTPTDSILSSTQSAAFVADPPSHIERPSRSIISANNRGMSSPPPFHQLAAFNPELAALTPSEALEATENRFNAEPSLENGHLLQAAINRALTLRETDQKLNAAAERAMALFGKKDKENEPPRTDNIWAQFYEHADFGGRSHFVNLSPGWSYWREPSFGYYGMNDMISSLRCGADANEVGADVVLFEDNRYFGRYTTFPVLPGRTQDFHHVDNDFNDIASSALIIRPPPNGRAARLSNLLPKSVITDIVNATPLVRPAGDPIFTWDMWPYGGSASDFHPYDGDKTFIYIIVPINVHTPPPYPDYYAQARYWIYLYVDGDGRIQGYVDYYGYYVESGTISGRVADGLKQEIPGTIPQVNALIDRALAAVNIGRYNYLYYLPGSWAFQGNVFDNVTIMVSPR